MRDTIADLTPEEGALILGNGAPISMCRTKTGYPSQPSTRALVDMLMKNYVFQYQSLVQSDATGNWRSNGSLKLNAFSRATGPVATYPLIIDYPVYIFRLGVPNGVQTINDTPTGRGLAARPQIGYRLASVQNAAGEPTYYYWDSFGVSQNCTNQPYTDTTLNMQALVRADDQSVMNTSKPIHKWSTVDVLYTDATTIQTTMVCGLVKFTRPEFCPPDYFYNGDTASTTPIPYRQNSNNLADDVASRIQHSEFWQKYIDNREGHPLRYQETGQRPPNVFNWLSKKVRVFTPQLSINYGTGTGNAPTGLQHKHHEFVHGMGMIDCSQDRLGNTVTVVNRQYEGGPTIDVSEVGVFPQDPTQERWFMMQCWPRRGINPTPTTPPFNIANEPTFDIRIRQGFASCENYI